MDERQRLFKIHGEHGSYEGLIRYYHTFEGAALLDVTVDVTNELQGRRRVLNARNDKLQRLPKEVLANEQEQLINACIAELNESESEIADSIEVKKIGFRLHLEEHEAMEAAEDLEKLAKAKEEFAKSVTPNE